MTDIFQYTSGPRDADIMIVGEAWGRQEDIEKLPFVGGSGQELTRILADGGIDREECFLTNLVHAQPSGNDMWRFFHPTEWAKNNNVQVHRGLFPKDNILAGLIELSLVIEQVKPKLIIALGNYALWALGNDEGSIGYTQGHRIPTAIVTWRGSQLYTRDSMGNIPMMPVIHPAAILRQWAYRYPTVQDIKRVVRKRDNWGPPKYNFRIRPSYHDVMLTLDYLTKLMVHTEVKLAVDLETRAGGIACIGLAWSNLEAICIPVQCVGKTDGYWDWEELYNIIVRLKRLFSNPNCHIIGQNFLYDAQYIFNEWFLRTSVYADTMLMQNVAWPGTPKGLDYLSSLYCDYHKYWKGEGKEWNPKIPEEVLWSYNCKDAVTTFESEVELADVIKFFGLKEQLAMQMQQFPMILNMMLRGVAVDTKRRAKLNMELMEAAAQREKRLEYLIPSDVFPRKAKASPWYRSPKQQMELFYEVLGQEVIRHRKTYKPTVDDEAIATIATRTPILRPLIEIIQEYRSIGVFHSNFIQAPLDPDGRIRSSFDPAGTETYRWASRKNAYGRGTNFQNIPEGSEE